MIRVMFIALAAACMALASQAMAQFNVGPGPLGPSDPARTTTVKSSKSNTSDRIGTTLGIVDSARTTTVKSSKSNTSDRLGGGGGRKGGAARASSVKSSKSNTSD